MYSRLDPLQPALARPRATRETYAPPQTGPPGSPIIPEYVLTIPKDDSR